ncbi:MAG: YfdX family protein [Candidatus Aureabacteria bacterium]|nr:YfdX family protein [Candidatus Auribacterota bacterium]
MSRTAYFLLMPWKRILRISSITIVSFLALTQAIAEDSDKSAIVTGSGKPYKTEVKRVTRGEISKDDLHQASLLTSRVMAHVEKSVNMMADNNIESAKQNIEKAQALIGIVREILPVTEVTTFVTDKNGKTVYENQERIQDDVIQIYSQMIELEVVEPIIEAKQDEAALKGLRLRDANVIYSSILVDLKYIERKLASAVRKIDKSEEALRELMLARTKGIDLKINEKDNPLIDVQKALKLAERMVEENKPEAAKYNLNIANIQLETYKNIIGEAEGRKARELQEEIERIKSKLESKDAARTIRELWQRTVSWFRQYPGQAHDTVINEKEPGIKK